MDEARVKSLPFLEVIRDHSKRNTQRKYFVDRLQVKSEIIIQRIMTSYAKRIRRLNLSGEELPSQEEIVEQSKDLVRAYIYRRLSHAGLTNRKFKGPEKRCEVADQIIAIGDDLEHRYPDLYRNISRQLNMTMCSEELVKRTFTSVAEHICKGEVHWGKIIALFAVAGGFSIDCASQGHPEYPNKIVDCFSTFVNKHVAEWVKEQGGWSDIITVAKGSSDNSIFWALSGLGAFAGFLLTLMTMVQL